MVVGEAELLALGEEFVELAGLEAGEADDVPEGAGDGAAHLEGAARGPPGWASGTKESQPSGVERRTARQRPEAMSQRRTVPSKEPEASDRPSGLKATLDTPELWPESARSSWPVAASHNRTVLSLAPEASDRPSGLKATLNTPELWPEARAARGLWPRPKAALSNPWSQRRATGHRG